MKIPLFIKKGIGRVNKMLQDINTYEVVERDLTKRMITLY